MVRLLAEKFVLIDGQLMFKTDQGLRRVPFVGERSLIVKQVH